MRDSVPCDFYWVLAMEVTSASTYQNSRLVEGKQVININLYIKV